MSEGPKGYVKYNCKYWLTYNCPRKVWVNNQACGMCMATNDEEYESMQKVSKIYQENKARERAANAEIINRREDRLRQEAAAEADGRKQTEAKRG